MPFFEDNGAIVIDINELELNLLKKIPLAENSIYEFMNGILIEVIKSYIPRLKVYIKFQLDKHLIKEETYKKYMDALNNCDSYEENDLEKKIKEMLHL